MKTVPDDQHSSKRILWRCRRGLLELDILLSNFVRHKFYELNTTQMQVFDRLLDLPDNQFLDFLLGRELSDDKEVNDLLLEIINSQS